MKPLIQKKGDVVKALLAGEVDYIMHCVNCQGVMGGGIAKQIKATFPNMFKQYLNYCNLVSKDETNRLLGHSLIVHKVINLFAQNNFGVHERQLHYGALLKALCVISQRGVLEMPSQLERPVSKIYIGVPKLMCCALAGGNWEVVSEMLQGLPDWIEIVVYDFN